MEVYSKVGSEPKDEVATIEREFKFAKGMALSVLASLITVPLHLTSAVNNLGLKCFVKCVINVSVPYVCVLITTSYDQTLTPVGINGGALPCIRLASATSGDCLPSTTS